MVNRHNNFGTLRLLFASLVIASHTPELLDGDRSRELLTMLFGTLTFGGLAVNGFFLMSGYLITKSMDSDPDLVKFAVNRVARIVPGFFAAFWISILLVGPFVTMQPVYTGDLMIENLLGSLILRTPTVPGAFEPAPIHHVNGALWTIAWEFLCYMAVAALGVVGLLNRRFRSADGRRRWPDCVGCYPDGSSDPLADQHDDREQLSVRRCLRLWRYILSVPG
ncbi:acyltransferase family protein [Brevundimonas variabilis]|uniref:Peptidoglycan/LPS O-acetylase OafA/YrhL n=1 Tax=Brevundimonas variabilis TaxID=74312 RepID=A0A7W9CIH6_9CAUL|nr:acyltransferase [Brevundimonas variabilis]MBB5746300.1 peptidoglycan/LPS O-acetylase OafA/YrhL [Brevundimonas variabilis]